MATIVPVVEGPGDTAALPQLLGRILSQMYDRPDVMVAQGKTRVVTAQNRSNLEKYLEKFLGHALNKPDCAAILVLVDADDDCPVTVSQQLTQRCEQIGTTVPIQVVYAHREYESWFLASLDTIRGRHGIPETATLAGGVEAVANPKNWLSNRMPTGQAYKETTHQASFSSAIDLDLARQNSRSFRRLCHALEQLLEGMIQSDLP